MPKCSLTHQKAEQRDFRHAVLSKPYKPVLCATTLGSPFFMWDKLLEGKGEKQNVPAVTGGVILWRKIQVFLPCRVGH